MRVACTPCRALKAKCDGEEPCHRCARRGDTCTYEERKITGRRATHFKVSRAQRRSCACVDTECTTVHPAERDDGRGGVRPDHRNIFHVYRRATSGVGTSLSPSLFTSLIRRRQNDVCRCGVTWPPYESFFAGGWFPEQVLRTSAAVPAVRDQVRDGAPQAGWVPSSFDYYWREFTPS